MKVNMKILIPVFALLLIFSFSLACNGESEEPKAVEGTATEVSEEPEGDITEDSATEEIVEESKFFSVGEAVNLEGAIVKVKEVEKSEGTEFDEPKSGMEYIIVTVNITNNSDDKISYNPYDFQMQNSKGQITDQAFSIVDSDTALSSGELAPGGEVEGTISFEQPKDDPELVLIYTPNFWNESENIKFKLN